MPAFLRPTRTVHHHSAVCSLPTPLLGIDPTATVTYDLLGLEGDHDTHNHKLEGLKYFHLKQLHYIFTLAVHIALSTHTLPFKSQLQRKFAHRYFTLNSLCRNERSVPVYSFTHFAVQTGTNIATPNGENAMNVVIIPGWGIKGNKKSLNNVIL